MIREVWLTPEGELRIYKRKLGRYFKAEDFGPALVHRIRLILVEKYTLIGLL